MNLQHRWQTYLDVLRVEGRYRALVPAAGIDFSSNDYLGYGGGRANLVAEATDLPRSGMASRLLRGHHPIWEEVESALASWHGAEAALMMTSGYVANEGLLATVIEPDDWVASDRCNHASIIDGLRLSKAERFIYPHNDMTVLEAGLRQAAQRPAGQRFIATESLFGMEGDRAPLTDLVLLAERYGAHVIVDEAHATGCFGPEGAGLVDAAKLRRRVLATVHTGGKALGTLGAYICGSARLIELLVNRCRHLIFTTALPPAVAPWWLAAVKRSRQDDAGRAALHENACRFRQVLARLGLDAGGSDFIVSLILGEDACAVEAARRLQEAGFDIRAIRPPTVPPGTARLRISIHADHASELVLRAAQAIANVCGT